MICEICGGAGFVRATDPASALVMLPCLECNGSGVASCCDAAGSSMSHFASSNDAEKRDMPSAGYSDDRFLERPCDRCGKPYRGPAVYCSLTCALADA
jgi:DnaJ-class molecular chaperone